MNRYKTDILRPQSFNIIEMEKNSLFFFKIFDNIINELIVPVKIRSPVVLAIADNTVQTLGILKAAVERNKCRLLLYPVFIFFLSNKIKIPVPENKYPKCQYISFGITYQIHTLNFLLCQIKP